MLKIDKKGQGILEVMTAIYIFIVALVSIMNLVVFNIQTNALNADILVASNLAREGIEAIRNMRDSNWENNVFFADGLRYNEKGDYIDQNISDYHTTFLLKNDYLSGKYGYQINTVAISWQDCISSEHGYFKSGSSKPVKEICKIYLITPQNNSSKQYDYGIYYDSKNIEATQFYRLIYINEICLNSSNQERILGDSDIDHSSSGVILNSGRRCDGYVGSSPIGLRIVSRVAWQSSHGLKEVKIEEKLYNWQKEKTQEIK